jgi:hypothetical protein
MEYQTLYADSERLQAALCNYYAAVVRLCQKAVEVSQRQGGHLKNRSASKASSMLTGLSHQDCSSSRWHYGGRSRQNLAPFKQSYRDRVRKLKRRYR